MKLFITARFKGEENKADIERLCEAVRAAGFEDFCFIRDIEKYQRGFFADPHKLMARMREELLKCDGLLIDVSDNPGGGRLIETGIAFGHNKPVIVMVKRGAQISTPILGVVDRIVKYDEIEDIVEPLKRVALTSQ